MDLLSSPPAMDARRIHPFAFSPRRQANNTHTQEGKGKNGKETKGKNERRGPLAHRALGEIRQVGPSDMAALAVHGCE